jgi:hypothetical protein
MISKVRTSILLYPDIEDLSISTNAPSIYVSDIEALCFDIEFLVLRCRCFFVGSSLGCCSSYSVLDTDRGVHIALRINHCTWLMRRPGRPQPLQHGLHSAARSHRSHRLHHRLQHRQQPPERRADQQSTSAVRAERRSDQQSTSTMTVAAFGKVPVAAYYEPQPWSEQWKRPEFALRRRLSYARYAQPSTERRSVRFHPAREGWTGAKFGMKI